MSESIVTDTVPVDTEGTPLSATPAAPNMASRPDAALPPVIISEVMLADPDYAPFDIYGAGAASPVIVSCPHAGRTYPASMINLAAQPVEELRGLEDFGVDCLLPDLISAGIPTVINRVARAYLDVNRAETALDRAMFSGDIDSPPPCHHVRAGYGLIPKLTAARKPIYGGQLPPTEVSARVEFVHRPYHETLTRLLDAAITWHGAALLVDMHSMPAFDRLNNRLPDIICGDGHGSTLDRETAIAITGFLEGCGLSVSWNHPYAGGFITRGYGDARTARQAVQIELNRALYMDGPTRLDPARAATLRGQIGQLGRFLAETGRVAA
ncbi:MAG: N-formylglutamate amidohydrolase [Pseudomonadota bacterium]|nr:N-formylglutamate amidohydrolase [Pseudomonadota bacterium]